MIGLQFDPTEPESVTPNPTPCLPPHQTVQAFILVKHNQLTEVEWLLWPKALETLAYAHCPVTESAAAHHGWNLWLSKTTHPVARK